MTNLRLRTATFCLAAAAAVGLAAFAPPEADPDKAPADPPPAKDTEGTGERIGEAVDRTANTIVQGVRDTAASLRERFAKARSSVQAMGVQTRVYTRLHWDKQLSDADLTPEVNPDGIAILRGTVPTASARMRALEVTRDTVGVTRVVDEMTVTAKGPADAEGRREPAKVPAPARIRDDR